MGSEIMSTPKICERCGEKPITECAGGFIEEGGKVFGCPAQYRSLRTKRLNEFLPAPPERYRDAKTEDPQIIAWASDGMKQSLIITGDYGTGKTHAAHAIARIARYKGKVARVVPLADLLQAVKDTFGDNSPDNITESEILSRCATLDLLILDDVGKERLTDWAEEWLWRLVNTRYNNELPIALTTNMTPAEMGGRDRIAAIMSRIRDGAKVIIFDHQWRTMGEIAI
jgi:DNA replication protein DnaC